MDVDLNDDVISLHLPRCRQYADASRDDLRSISVVPADGFNRAARGQLQRRRVVNLEVERRVLQSLRCQLGLEPREMAQEETILTLGERMDKRHDAVIIPPFACGQNNRWLVS